MTDDNSTRADAKDGFDLIEYPCDYNFKAMCKAIEGVDLKQQLGDLVVLHLHENALLRVTSSSSRTGKFESITMIVRLDNRDQLEAVYQAIAAAPSVVMTL